MNEKMALRGSRVTADRVFQTPGLYTENVAEHNATVKLGADKTIGLIPHE
jgi:hypothetical protein